MNVEALRQLALDIADNFHCKCFTDDLETDDCPCGGDGRVNADGDGGVFEGCWHCQALVARRPRCPGPAGVDRGARRKWSRPSAR